MKIYKMAFYCGLAAIPAACATVNFSDGNFTTGWSDPFLQVLDSADFGISTSNPATGGNPNFFRQEDHSGTRDGSAISLAGFNMLALNSAAIYDPSSQGAILSLDYAYDVIHLGGNVSVAIAPGLTQGGKVYRYYTGAQVASSNVWSAIAANGLTNLNFNEVTNSSVYATIIDTNSHPDFSAAGGQVTFGYIVANGWGGTINATTGIDNWSVTLNTADTPEPGTWSVVLIGLGGIALSRVRRRN